MKSFNGKAIYNPSGKAGEYSYWACNFYVGCSNGCEYFYLKKGILACAMGGDTPKLKACFKNERHALEIFEKELRANLSELQKHGLFFSFTTDPLLPKNIDLTFGAICTCFDNNIPVKILTKRADFIKTGEMSMFYPKVFLNKYRHLVAFGFTLTGHDELEPNASTNVERIEAMRKLHNAGFKTWASIEPIIDIDNSLKVIEKTQCFCDLYKVGLMSGKKYDADRLRDFIFYCTRFRMKFYFKDSFLKQARITREKLSSAYNNYVGRDYNIFNS